MPSLCLRLSEDDIEDSTLTLCSTAKGIDEFNSSPVAWDKPGDACHHHGIGNNQSIIFEFTSVQSAYRLAVERT